MTRCVCAGIVWFIPGLSQDVLGFCSSRDIPGYPGTAPCCTMHPGSLGCRCTCTLVLQTSVAPLCTMHLEAVAVDAPAPWFIESKLHQGARCCTSCDPGGSRCVSFRFVSRAAAVGVNVPETDWVSLVSAQLWADIVSDQFGPVRTTSVTYLVSREAARDGRSFELHILACTAARA